MGKRGRRLGTKRISLEQLETIIEMSKNQLNTRKEIAKKARCGVITVYNYQKAYDLI